MSISAPSYSCDKINAVLARTSCRILSVALLACALGCNIVYSGRTIHEFSPAKWPKEVRDRYVALQTGTGFDWQKRKRIEPQRSAEGSQMMIASTNEPLAVRIGFEVLKQGGTAADAVVATEMAQIALTAGASISYAGMMTAVYYDAGSGKVSAMNASFNTVRRRLRMTRNAIVQASLSAFNCAHLWPRFQRYAPACHGAPIG